MIVGSRGYDFIDYASSCTISGVDKNKSMHIIHRPIRQIMTRCDFVDFCFEFLSYKFGLTSINNVSLTWLPNEWSYANNKIHRSSLYTDFTSVSKILTNFNKNFEMSDAPKISY